MRLILVLSKAVHAINRRTFYMGEWQLHKTVTPNPVQMEVSVANGPDTEPSRLEPLKSSPVQSNLLAGPDHAESYLRLGPTGLLATMMEVLAMDLPNSGSRVWEGLY